jgi:type IV pilus assembly protein PilW
MLQHISSKRPSRQFMHGMSLPEILAAVLIGLIGMIVIMQVYATSEERKRTTTGTSDAQINGNIAAFTLESAIRSAGFGMVSPNNNMLGCNTLAYNSNLATPDFSFLMAPLVITVGAAGAPDNITVISGSSSTVVEGSKFVAAAASGADFSLKNAAGFLQGDLVVASEPGLNCTLAEITGFDVAAVNTIQHAVVSYSYVNTANATVNMTATYNKAGGSGVAYSANALLFSLGRTPSVVTYQIASDKLQASTLIPYAAAPTSDIADAIVQLKALYGKDTNGDDVVDTWNTTTPANATQWLQVRAVRIALLARSAKFEKTAVTDDCIWPNPPVKSPFWSNGCFTMTNLTGGGSVTENDWHHYRYRTYETVVPLRNMIWSN